MFKTKTVEGKTLLEVTYKLVEESKQKRSKTQISNILTQQFPPFKDFTKENGYDRMKLLSSMKMMIKCKVLNLPTKVTYYQESGKNYPPFRRFQEIENFVPNPTDYDSDETTQSQKDQAMIMKKKIQNRIIEIKRNKQKMETSYSLISLNEICIHIVSLYLEDFDRYSLSQTCWLLKNLLTSKNFHFFIEKEEQNMTWDSYQVDKRWIEIKQY